LSFLFFKLPRITELLPGVRGLVRSKMCGEVQLRSPQGHTLHDNNGLQREQSAAIADFTQREPPDSSGY